jgi:hypothetical protein
MKLELTDKQAVFLIKTLVQNYAEDAEDFDPPENIGASSTGGFIIGKLCREIGYEAYTKSRKERYLENPVNKKLFMGAGYHSKLLMNQLHRRLSFAFAQLSGLQQNGGMGYEFDDTFDKRGNQDIKDVLKDLLIAFNLTAEDLK